MDRPKRRRPAERRPRRLLEEIQVLSIVVSTLIIIGVETVSLSLTSNSMVADLRKRSLVTADETVALLEDPLYNIDDPQAVRIGEALLSSGRISGIVLESTATGLLMSVAAPGNDSLIPPLSREIVLEGLRLGTVRLSFSDADVMRIRSLFASITLVVLVSVLIANILAYRFIIRRRLSRPIAGIASGIDAIADGHYDRPIPESEYEDLNLLVRLINDMAAKVLSKSRELLDANVLLERRVAERTAALEDSMSGLRQAQALLVESEKLSALGHLSAGMAHELNTPLGAIVSSNRSIIEYLDREQGRLVRSLSSLPEEQRELYDRTMELARPRGANLRVSSGDFKRCREITGELAEAGAPNAEEAAASLVELDLAERWRELGPALFDPRGAETLALAAEAILARRMAEVVAVAAEKATGVVSALRFYLNPEAHTEDAPVEIVRDIENVLILLHHSLKHGITIRRELVPVSTRGSSDKLSQVWINLIRNAAQAMNFEGEITLRTGIRDGLVRVMIGDTGPGIPPELRERIFEPFFTTKKKGEGMGIGLGICKEIIAAHGGSISLESRPGKTEFTVTLPNYGAAGGPDERGVDRAGPQDREGRERP